MAALGSSLLLGITPGAASQQPSPVPRSASGNVAMTGAVPANTNWVPEPSLNGIPVVGDRLLEGVSFTRGLVEEAGLLARQGVIYARGYFGDSNERVVFALDAVTGEERWRAVGADALLAIAPSTAIVQRLGRDDAPDTVSAMALDGSGANVWQVEARAQGRTVVVDDFVIVSTSDGPLAIDATTGLMAWDRRDLELAERSDIAVGDDILVGSDPTETNQVRAFSLGSGDALWEIELDRPVQTAPLIADDGVWVCDPLDLIELDLHSGAERRRIELRQAMPFRGRLALAGSTMVVSDSSGLSAFDLTTGEIRWSYAPRFGTAFELMLAGRSAYLLVNDGASFETHQVVQAIDLETGEPRWEVPEPGSNAAADDIWGFLVVDDTLWLASANGLRACAFSDTPDPGIASPIQGNAFTSESAGFSYTWTDEWEPGDTDWFLGEDGLRFQSTDGQALATQYVDHVDEPASPEEVAWSIAGVPPGGELSLDPSPLFLSFPRTFGTDTSRLRGLEAAMAPALAGSVPDGAGVALVLAHTVLDPPFDRMLVLIVAVPLRESETFLVFEFATSETSFDAWLPSFLAFFDELTVE